MRDELHQQVHDLVAKVVAAMGLAVEVKVADLDDGSIRVDLVGADGAELLHRKGEGLEALQHLVNTSYRRALGPSQRIVVDTQDFRHTKDVELQLMARFLIDKAKTTGLPQELGPLNSYARRMVHLEVARDAEVTSESQGDGQLKVVIIARRTPLKAAP
jgi:spoIIIJ-associated protein